MVALSPLFALLSTPAAHLELLTLAAIDPQQAVVRIQFQKIVGDTMEYAAFVFGILGLVAFVRVEKLVKTLKEKGVLDQDYKDE